MIHIKTSASILGCRVLYYRYPHQKKVTDTIKIDKELGTYNGIACSLPNNWQHVNIRVNKHSQGFLCRFHVASDGLLTLESVDGSTNFLKVPGDVLNHCFYHNKFRGEEGFKIYKHEVDMVPESEGANFVEYQTRIDYRTLEIKAY
jgi:hypothetical protein